MTHVGFAESATAWTPTALPVGTPAALSTWIGVAMSAGIKLGVCRGKTGRVDHLLYLQKHNMLPPTTPRERYGRTLPPTFSKTVSPPTLHADTCARLFCALLVVSRLGTILATTPTSCQSAGVTNDRGGHC